MLVSYTKILFKKIRGPVVPELILQVMFKFPVAEASSFLWGVFILKGQFPVDHYGTLICPSSLVNTSLAFQLWSYDVRVFWTWINFWNKAKLSSWLVSVRTLYYNKRRLTWLAKWSLNWQTYVFMPQFKRNLKMIVLWRVAITTAHMFLKIISHEGTPERGGMPLYGD